jgi:hypothetical protein
MSTLKGELVLLLDEALLTLSRNVSTRKTDISADDDLAVCEISCITLKVTI